MEQRGLLKSWNDDKGFGFILPQQGGAEVFAHISAMRGGRRPVAGEQVLYIVGKDPHGRARAEHIRRAGDLAPDRPAIRRKPASAAPRSIRLPGAKRQAAGPTRNLGVKLMLFAALCCLPLFGAIQLLLATDFIWVLAGYAAASLISFGQYWNDKLSALSGRWRTPENALHLVELLGGWPGALLAQQCFRHKTRKLYYQLLFWTIIVAHQLFWIDWLLLDGAYFGDLVGNYLRR